MSKGIIPITMPKWGLSMQEGKVVEWLADEGAALSLGDPVMDIETEKIANTFEALDAGVLRRRVALEDDVLPIGALLGVRKLTMRRSMRSSRNSRPTTSHRIPKKRKAAAGRRSRPAAIACAGPRWEMAQKTSS